MSTALDTSELTDEQLAAAAAAEGSDGPAFVALVTRYQQRVWRVCHRLMGREDDASDAAQEVFVRLFLNRAKFLGRSKYSTWVHGVAVRTCLQMRRGLARLRRHEDDARRQAAAKQTRATQPPGPGLALDLMQILDVLDEDDRALLIMKYAEGHDYRTLAKIFDLSVSACKMRISRACEKLQRRFPEHHFGDAAD